MIDSFELSPKRYLLTIIGQRQPSKQTFVAGQVGHVKTVPFRSMNIIARSLDPRSRMLQLKSTSMFNFLGACGCDQGILESLRKLVEFTSRRSRNSKSGGLMKSWDIGGSVACGRSLCSELRRYDAVCGQLGLG